LAQKTSILTLRLSTRDAKRISSVQELSEVDRATLLREFIEDGLRKRVLAAYEDGRITAEKAAEILDIPLREFLTILEKQGLEINWDKLVLTGYMSKRVSR
jgi:predicted HTH domain antitoxin